MAATRGLPEILRQQEMKGLTTGGSEMQQPDQIAEHSGVSQA
jgi:hypothetical protein